MVPGLGSRGEQEGSGVLVYPGVREKGAASGGQGGYGEYRVG